MDAFREIGPGGHFLGAAHTQANFESAFYRSEIADNNSFEQWEEEGSLDAAMRANSKWKEMLNEYEAPELDPAIDEALLEFIAKRKSEFEDRDYWFNSVKIRKLSKQINEINLWVTHT